MSTLLWFVTVAYLLSMAVFALSMFKAPRGYQDDNGFHFGLAPRRFMFARRRPSR